MPTSKKGKRVIVLISSSSSEEEEESDEQESQEKEEDFEEEEEEEDEESLSEDVGGSTEEEEDGDDADDEEEEDDDCADDDGKPSDEELYNKVIDHLRRNKSLDTLKLEECKIYLRKHMLGLSGTKATCAERILEHWSMRGWERSIADRRGGRGRSIDPFGSETLAAAEFRSSLTTQPSPSPEDNTPQPTSDHDASLAARLAQTVESSSFSSRRIIDIFQRRTDPTWYDQQRRTAELRFQHLMAQQQLREEEERRREAKERWREAEERRIQDEQIHNMQDWVRLLSQNTHAFLFDISRPPPRDPAQGS